MIQVDQEYAATVVQSVLLQAAHVFRYPSNLN
jgi:hypothetical protein